MSEETSIHSFKLANDATISEHPLDEVLTGVQNHAVYEPEIAHYLSYVTSIIEREREGLGWTDHFEYLDPVGKWESDVLMFTTGNNIVIAFRGKQSFDQLKKDISTMTGGPFVHLLPTRIQQNELHRKEKIHAETEDTFVECNKKDTFVE
ncbi:hypothetical protein KIPB_009792 [Kipferlia bialata]|uniref:Uncharacterized protein n=1 Tax=Kipferlia bialata TaxID=797122 RepID=A0A9K3D4B8_9EUKA|nr:hypothetical protein KIPB_009792 [Kipferlia bialata]|eukprot:g9792.t1